MNKFPRVEKVILSHQIRGNGTEGNPFRTVLIITDLDGNFIAENDYYQTDKQGETHATKNNVTKDQGS